jgi:hypothetical protein
MKREPSVAASILRSAADIVDGSRSKNGDPERSFRAIAADWTMYLANRRDPHGPVREIDVAWMLQRLKTWRAEWGDPNIDHFRDAAGFSGLAGELASQ